MNQASQPTCRSCGSIPCPNRHDAAYLTAKAQGLPCWIPMGEGERVCSVCGSREHVYGTNIFTGQPICSSCIDHCPHCLSAWPPGFIKHGQCSHCKNQTTGGNHDHPTAQ